MTGAPTTQLGLAPSWRRLVHASMLLPALLLPYLTWGEALLLTVAAFLFNLAWLPAFKLNLTRQTGREEYVAARGGILLFPVSVFLLLFIFRHSLYIAAAAWALLSLGDAAAAALGRHATRRWRLNPRKSWVGTAAYALVGFPGAWFMLHYLQAPGSTLRLAVVASLGAAVAAIAELCPSRLDDNLVAPFAGALAMKLGFIWSSALGLEVWHRIAPHGLEAILVCGALALLAAWGGAMTEAGAVTGFVVAVSLYLGLGRVGFLLLLTFFVMGNVATGWGYARKRTAGLAESRGGKRNTSQAIANGGVAALAAVASLLGWGVLGAVAAAAALAEAAADTVSSEVGQLAGVKSPDRGWARTYMILLGRAVAAGTDGGVSIAGTAAGWVASAGLTAVAAASGLLHGGDLVIIWVAANLGSVVDSVLGATLEREGILKNNDVNFLGTAAAAVLAVGLHLMLRLG